MSKKVPVRLIASVMAVSLILAACAPSAPVAPAAPTALTATDVPVATTAVEATQPPEPTAAPTVEASTAITPEATAALVAKLANADAPEATADKDTPLMVSLRNDLGFGYWGFMTHAPYNFQGEFSPFVIMPLVLPVGTDYKPWLAESWSVAPDCRSATINLHKTATWSDGTPITSKDLIYTLQLLYDKDSKHPWVDPKTAILANVTGAADYSEGKATSVKGLTAVDDHTVKIDFDAPGTCKLFGVFQLEVVGVLPEHVLNKYTAAQLWAGDFPEANDPTVYSGPYRVVKFDAEQKFTEIERNENWWGNAVFGKPAVKRFAGQPAGVPELIAGTTNVLSVGPIQEVARLQQEPNLEVTLRPWNTFGLIFNARTERQLPPEVRQAILLAINREAHIQVRNLGAGKPLGSPFSAVEGDPSWCEGDNCDPAFTSAIPYNPVQSKELLTQANWDPNRTLTIIGGGADNPSVLLLQQELAAIGIKAEVSPSPDLEADLAAKGEYDLWWALGFPYNNPVAFCGYWLDETDSDYWTSRVGWKAADRQPFIDACKEGVGTADPAKQQEAFVKAAQLWETQGPLWYIGQAMRSIAHSKNVGGIGAMNQLNILGYSGDLGIASWFWRE